MDHVTLAGDLFLEGFNCAQAVAVAFTDVTGMDKQAAAKLAAPFGGGMGRMREVCGAVSGMFMVLGALYGYDNSDADSKKKELYKQVQDLAEQFRQENGSVGPGQQLRKHIRHLWGSIVGPEHAAEFCRCGYICLGSFSDVHNVFSIHSFV